MTAGSRLFVLVNKIFLDEMSLFKLKIIYFIDFPNLVFSSQTQNLLL